jgi:hypothetical protein
LIRRATEWLMKMGRKFSLVMKILKGSGRWKIDWEYVIVEKN